MARQGRALLALGGLLIVGVSAGLFAVMGDGPAPAERGGESARPAAPTDGGAAPAAAADRRRARPTGTAAVFGVLRQSRGEEPAAGRTVRLELAGEETWTAETAEDGGFRFADLPGGGPYEVRVAEPGFAEVRVPGLALDRGEQRDVGTLWLDRAVAVAVKVRSLRDEPLEGARVEAFPAAEARFGFDWSKALAQSAAEPVAVHTATTDAEGRARFSGVAKGSWTFVATKDGYARGGVRRGVAPAGDEDEVTIHLAPGHPLGGSVTDGAGKALPGVLVLAGRPGSAWDFGSSPLRHRTTADAEGRYAFAALEAGDTLLYVGLAGRAPVGLAVVRVPAVAEFDLVLHSGGRLTGKVTDKATGEPVEGAVIRAMSWGISPRVAEATTDPEGVYAIDPAPDVNVNQLTLDGADGWVIDEQPGLLGAEQPTVVPQGQTVVRDFVVRRGARLVGTVRGPGGPVRGARVSAYVMAAPGSWAQRHAVADGEGRYEVVGLPEGRALVQVVREGLQQPEWPENWWQAVQQRGPHDRWAVEVPASGEVTLDVELVSGGTVAGRVEDEEGRPLAGVAVRAHSGGARSSAATTDAEGAFRIEDAPFGGQVGLAAEKQDWTPVEPVKVAVEEGRPALDVVLRLMPRPRVRGVLSSADGRPLGEAWVQVAPSHDRNQPWNAPWQWANAAKVPVRADGSYEAEVPVPPGGSFDVRASALEAQVALSDPVACVAGQREYRVDLVLGRGGRITGRVLAQDDRAPVAGAHVTVQPRPAAGQPVFYGAPWMQQAVLAVTSADGAFALENVAEGPLEVRASRDGFVAGTAAADAKERTPVEVRLERELGIAGVVVYGDGRPAAGVQVSAEPESGGPVSRVVFGPNQLVTGQDGSFEVRGLSPGRYTVTFGGGFDSRVNVLPVQEVVEAGRRDLRIVVAAGGVISGRVLGPGREPVSGVWINASPKEPRPGVPMGTAAHTDREGRFEVVGLVDGAYQLSVNPQQQGGGLKQTHLESVQSGTTDLEIVLDAGLAIEGVLVDVENRPLPNVWINATQRQEQDGRVHYAGGGGVQTDSAGRFTLGGLAPGAYRLNVQWSMDGKQYLVDSGDVAAGARGVRIVATEGERIAGVVVDERGAGVQGASVNVQVEGGAGRHTVTDAEGAFEVGGLPRGSHRLHVAAKGHVSQSLSAVESGTAALRIVLARGLAARGRLLDAAGKPVPEASIFLVHASDPTVRRHVRTDAGGNFDADGLVEGEYNATAPVRAEGNKWTRRPCGTLRAGDTAAELRIE